MEDPKDPESERSLQSTQGAKMQGAVVQNVLYPTRKFVSFDLEFDNPLPQSWGTETSPEQRQQNDASVSIIAAAVFLSDGWNQSQRTFRSLAPLPLGQDKLAEFARFLLEMSARGFVVVTWGGAASDFRVLSSKLAFAPQLQAQIVRLCEDHVDIALSVLSEHGMMVGLESCCRAIQRNPSATKKETSKTLGELWKQGGKNSLRVLRHVQEDAIQTARVYGFVLSSRFKRFQGSFCRPPVDPRIVVPQGKAWLVWNTKNSEKTMVVQLRVFSAGGWARLSTVREAETISRSRSFPWQMKEPFTVESCLRWKG